MADWRSIHAHIRHPNWWAITLVVILLAVPVGADAWTTPSVLRGVATPNPEVRHPLGDAVTIARVAARQSTRNPSVRSHIAWGYYLRSMAAPSALRDAVRGRPTAHQRRKVTADALTLSVVVALVVTALGGLRRRAARPRLQ